MIDLGAPKVAKILQRTALADLAESYSFVHLELPDDRYHDARVYLQDRLAERCWNRLPKPDRQAIRVVVEEAVSSGAIRPGSDRRPLAEAILGLPLG